MFKYSAKIKLACDRPAFTKLIDESKTIRINNDYILQFENFQKVSIIKKSIKEEKEMSMLSEKKQEILAKIDAILADRNARIDEQVKIYRESLEAEPEPAEVIELRKVIEAIDTLIAHEEIKPVEEEAPKEIPVEPVQEVAAEVEEVEIEEIPTQEELHLEEETPIVEEEIKIEIPTESEIQPTIEAEVKEEVISGIPAGEVVQPERPGLAEIQIPERG